MEGGSLFLADRPISFRSTKPPFRPMFFSVREKTNLHMEFGELQLAINPNFIQVLGFEKPLLGQYLGVPWLELQNEIGFV